MGCSQVVRVTRHPGTHQQRLHVRMAGPGILQSFEHNCPSPFTQDKALTICGKRATRRGWIVKS